MFIACLAPDTWTWRYRGATLVWQRGGVYIDFTQLDDQTLSDDPNWTDLGTSTDWKLGVTNGISRIQIPDGLIGGFWDFRSSYGRYNHLVNPADDGYVECQPLTRGDVASLTHTDGYGTFVYGRGNNTGSRSNGIGLWLQAGHVYLASYVGSTLTKRADGGTFQAGDLLRVSFTGNLHILTVNGVEPNNGNCRFNDTAATISKGTGFRSLIVSGSGAKDLLGPRRFSPSLGYVRMG